MLVDIHNHILFGLDDGAQNIDETARMARQAVKNGITHIIATPHHKNGKYDNPATVILSRVNEVNNLLQTLEIPLTVLPGMEIHLHGDIVKGLKQSPTDLLTLNQTNKYILIELPYSHIPHFTEEIFYELQLLGYVPVIAHAERNREFQKHPNQLYNLIQKGALAQITAASVTGVFGRELQKFSRRLFKHSLVHFIATDAHNTDRRGFELKSAYEYINLHFSEKHVRYLQENAIKLVNDLDFSVWQPSKFEKRTKFKDLPKPGNLVAFFSNKRKEE